MPFVNFCRINAVNKFCLFPFLEIHAILQLINGPIGDFSPEGKKLSPERTYIPTLQKCAERCGRSPQEKLLGAWE